MRNEAIPFSFPSRNWSWSTPRRNCSLPSRNCNLPEHTIAKDSGKLKQKAQFARQTQEWDSRNLHQNKKVRTTKFLHNWEQLPLAMYSVQQQKQEHKKGHNKRTANRSFF